MNKILVTGSSGYLANYIMKTLAKQHPNVLVLGMSRSGKPREAETAALPNVHYIKGDCLDPLSFRDHLADGVTGVIHCVGTLIEGKDYKSSYNAMNRDTAIYMAKELQNLAQKNHDIRNFVMISSEKAPPFLDAYLTTKKQAEEYILEECPNLQPLIIRPGFIYDYNHRWWSLPVKLGNDVAYTVNDKILKHAPFSDKFSFLFPAKSTQLFTVAKFAIEGALGENQEKIVTNERMLKFEGRF